MRKIYKNSIATTLIVSLVLVAGLSGPSPAAAATMIDLGAAADFAVLAGSAIVDTNISDITGDVGLSPASGSFIQVPDVEVDGTIYAVDAAGPAGSVANPTLLTAAKDALTAAYTNASNQVPASTIGSELGGSTITPGVYNSGDGEFHITGTVTLDAQNNADAVFIFNAASTLVTAASSTVRLINGANACNVFWRVGSSNGQFGTNSTFKGTVMADQSIVDAGGSIIEGRLLARIAQVTLNNTHITVPTCAAAVPSGSESNYNTITVFKQVINDAGGTAKFSDFPLFISGSRVNSGESVRLAPGTYTITETSLPGYTTTFTGNCDSTGEINHGWYNTHNDVCIVVNDDIGVTPIVPVAPLIDIVKVPSPLSLPSGPGQVTYTYTVSNVGTVPITEVTLVGDTCSPIMFISGDTNSDSKLDVSEKWVYRCTKTLSETTTNTVVATGYANGISAVDIANAKVVVGLPIVSPLIHITKVPNPLSLPSGSGTVVYTEKVTNPGTVALSNISVTDDKCGVVSYVSGDTDNDLKLDLSETWTYTCSANITKTTTNTAIATGEANGLIATDFALATVVASPKLPSTGSFFDGENTLWIIILILAVIFVSAILLYFVRKKRTI